MRSLGQWWLALTAYQHLETRPPPIQSRRLGSKVATFGAKSGTEFVPQFVRDSSTAPTKLMYAVVESN